MRDRVGLLIALALGAGILAAFLAFTFLRSPDAPEQFQRVETGATVPVVVAAQDMDVGTVVEDAFVRVVDWPGAALPAGYASSPAEVVGRGVIVPIRTNEPFLPQKLASEELGRGLAMIIPEGFRAVSVPVNDVVSVAGWVRPGTRVDVLVTLNSVLNQQEPITQIVLQNVQVLGNDRSIQRDAQGEAVPVSVVTVLVTPEQAERLAMAESDGRLQLALRNNIDIDTLETLGVRTSQLLRARPAPVFTGGGGPARPAQPARVTVEVYRGPQRSESTVERGGGGG
jgi:pilus assembly protein CpaB